MAAALKFLVTGGAGAIGRRLVARLIDEGMAVRILTLPGDTAAGLLKEKGVEVIYGDIANPEVVNGLCSGVDIVIHCAAVILSKDEAVFDRVNVTGTRYLLTDARNSGVKHFVHISSASVVYRKMTPYSRSKRIAERYIKESRVPWTILRPTLVYGEKGGLEFDMFLEKLGRFPVVPVIGSGKARKRPVYVGDLVDGIVRAALQPAGKNRIYNLSGGSTITMFDFTKLCLTLLGRDDRIMVRIPVPFCSIAATFLGRFMREPFLTWNMIAGAIQHADIDPEEAIVDLGYHPAGIEQKIGDCFPRQTE